MKKAVGSQMVKKAAGSPMVKRTVGNQMVKMAEDTQRALWVCSDNSMVYSGSKAERRGMVSIAVGSQREAKAQVPGFESLRAHLGS